MDKLIMNPAGAYGGQVSDAAFQLLFPFVSADAGALLYGQVVSLAGANLARKTISKATTGVVAVACIGITVEAFAIGDTGLVCIHGLVPQAVAQGAIAALDQVGRSGTTAGSVATLTSDASLIAGTALGLAVSAATGGLCDVYVRQV